MLAQLEKQLFNLKFASKQLERSSKKCEKEEKAEKLKLKKVKYSGKVVVICDGKLLDQYVKAIQKGNLKGAKIHAENSIRQKNQGLNFLRMSTRVDAVSQRVQAAVAMKQATQSMADVVASLDSALKSMDLEKVSALMDEFEKQFEFFYVQSSYMESAMSNATTLTIPQSDVDNLIQEVADESGLELNMELPQGQTSAIGQASASQEQEDLSQRLAKLQNM